jgi:hypothetical protein
MACVAFHDAVRCPCSKDGRSGCSPGVSREATGAPARLPEPGRNWSRSNPGSRVKREETTRANWWAKPVNALPVPCLFAQRARSVWAAACWRSNRTAAAEQAPLRSAFPLVLPEGP